MKFYDRMDAGQQLAKELTFESDDDVLVLALPRGGVPVGVEIAKFLDVPLDMVITRKIGAPTNPEYAIGAIAEDAKPLLNKAETAKVDAGWLAKEIAAEEQEIQRRREMYFENHARQSIKGKTIVLVDDGIATGYTVLAAIEEVQRQSPKKLILAVPVIPKEMDLQLRMKVDEIVALDVPEYFLGAIGAYYEEFHQLSDMEVRHLMNETRK